MNVILILKIDKNVNFKKSGHTSFASHTLLQFQSICEIAPGPGVDAIYHILTYHFNMPNSINLRTNLHFH